MLLLIALVVFNATAPTYQMIGVFYPLTLCGAVHLIDNNFFQQPITSPVSFLSNLLVIGLVVLVLVMRQPRFLGMVDRYCLKPPVTHQFSMAQIDNIASVVGKETLDIDISKALPQFYYFPLIEFGRRDIALQWLPDTWKLLFPYRTWSPPTYPDSGTFRLAMIDDYIDPSYTLVYKTNQYQLLKKTLKKTLKKI